MRRLRDRIRLRDEHGQSLVLFAAALPMLLSAAALVVDGSHLFVNKRSLQNAADAAALAAAQDLGGATCGSPCANTTGKYAGLNNSNPSSPPTSQTPLPACTAGSTNCYTNPYKGDPIKIEVRLTRHVNTIFGRILGLGRDVTARSVARIDSGPPPELTFAALNQGAGCDHHTLVIRSSGILTVNNNIYVNSCSGTPGNGKGDGFDIFGTGGCVRAKDIFTYGGWETHTGLSVYIPVPAGPPATCSGTPVCPVLTATSTTPWQAGCPHTGQPPLVDPFAGKILPPALDPAGVANTSCTAANPCYNVSEFSTPCWLDSSISAAATTLVADATGLDNTQCGPLGDGTPPYYISVDGERMQVTHRANAPPGGLSGSKTLSVTRGTLATPVLGTVAAAHTEPSLTVDHIRSADNVVTLTTSSQHNLNIGDWVRVNLTSPNDKYDGVFQVKEIPDFETAANPVQFTYDLPGGHQPDIGAAIITGVRRLSEKATVTTAAPLPASFTVGPPASPVVVDITNGDTSFDEELEDGVTVEWISGDRLSFRYAQPGLPDTFVPIKQIGRFDGIATIVTNQNHKFSTGDDGIIDYPPDSSFNGTFPVTVASNTKFTYPNGGPGHPDVPPSTLGGQQAVDYVARWNNVAWMTTHNNLGGIGDTWPDNNIVVNGVGLAGTDSSFDGTFDINAGSLQNGNMTFSYPNVGGNSSAGSPISVAFAGRNNGGVVTLTVGSTESTATLAKGDAVIVGLTSDTSYNNNGDPVILTNVTATQIQYQSSVLNQPHGNNTAATGNFKLLGGAPPIGSNVKRRQKANETTVNGSGDPCEPLTQPPCTVKPFTADADGVVGSASAAGNVAGPLFEIFSVTSQQDVPSSQTTPAEYKVPAGIPHPPLNPGTYYGGLCIGAPIGASCGSKVGGSCATSAATPTTLTLNPGIYIMAGGGFFVCGNTTLIAKGVMIYNTVNSASLAPGANAKAAELDQVVFNTNGEVFMTGVRDAPYTGMTIFQGTNPAPVPAAVDPISNPNLQLSPTVNPWKCDGRAVNSTDIALLHMGTNGLGNPAVPDSGISGTIYAPAQYALFRDTVSGTATLAVVTGCIFIDGANSTFNFDTPPDPDHTLFGIGYALSE
jgi:hypothetical protein